MLDSGNDSSLFPTLEQKKKDRGMVDINCILVFGPAIIFFPSVQTNIRAKTFHSGIY